MHSLRPYHSDGPEQVTRPDRHSRLPLHTTTSADLCCPSHETQPEFVRSGRDTGALSVVLRQALPPSMLRLIAPSLPSIPTIDEPPRHIGRRTRRRLRHMEYKTVCLCVLGRPRYMDEVASSAGAELFSSKSRQRR